MTLRTKLLLPAVVTLLIALVVMIALRPASPVSVPVPAESANQEAGESSAPESLISIASTPTTPSEVMARLVRYSPGDELTYHFRRRHRVGFRSEGSGALASPGALQSFMSGRLQIRVYEATDDDYLMGFETHDLRLAMGHDELPQTLSADEVGVELADEVLVSVSRQGRLGAIAFPGELSDLSRNSWRDLLASWQVVLPDVETDSWESTEDDTTGCCLYQYALEDDLIVKIRDHYVAVRNTAGLPLTGGTHTEGVTEITLADHQPTRITGDATLQLPIADGRTLTATWEFELSRLSATRNPDLAASGLEARRRFESASPTTLAAVDLPEADALPVPSEPEVRALLAEIRDIIARLTVRSPEAVAAMARLADFMRASPRAVELAFAELSQAPGKDPFSSLVLGAMGAAGTEAVQEALRDVFDSRAWPDTRRVAALFALAQVTDPTGDIDDTLRRIASAADPCAATSLLVLGAVADRVRDQPERRGTIHAELEGMLDDPRVSPARRLLAVEALGNLGPEKLPALFPELYARGDAALRRATLRALRRTGSADATRFLTDAALGDASEKLRQEALTILGDGKREGGIHALAEIVFEGKTPSLRRRALDSLVQRLDEEPSIREVVAWVVDSDPADELRSHAAELLARL